MRAGKALQLDVTAAIKGQVLATAERLVHGVAHQNLPAAGFGGDACRHRAVAAEQVVAAAHRAAHVDADPNSNPVAPLVLCTFVKRVLHIDTAAHRLLGVGKGNHEPVTLTFHDVPRAL